MTNRFLGKTYAEIDENILEKTIAKYGNLNQGKSGQGVPWNWREPDISACTISSDVKDNWVWLDGNWMKKLEDEIGQEIRRHECYLFETTTKDNPLPIIVKKNGKIYAVSPTKIIGE